MVEAARLTTADSSGDNLPVSAASQDEYLQIEQEEYDHPLQYRIDNEWANLLGRDFKPSRNVAVFRDKVSQFQEIATIPKMVPREDFLRKLAYIKIGALIVANSYQRSISKLAEHKLMEEIPTKYNSHFITEERQKGRSIPDIRSQIRDRHEKGEICLPEGIEIPPEEQEARMPRTPSFTDPIQDLVDTWQRSTYGSDLLEHDSVGVALGEVNELLDEFKDLSDDEINSVEDEEKLGDILGEVADAGIAIDGVFAAENECIDRWQNFALDRMIDTYGDVPKLRRMGVPTEVAMDFLSNCRYREDNGLPRPIDKRIPEYYRGPTFQIHAKSPHELDSASGMQH